ncbi:MAG: 2,3,4,5-tetrahydropyridine-2,6-dicarboxylate N-succinyltransferase [Actinobacteria bacterium]|nr:2,3,4,5-tetrahydropyridine-2,6-dicarboxylate N-succinyltransferase [Actinomycetota bacterium]
MITDLKASIEELWENRGDLSPGDSEATAAVHEAIDLLDRGEVRVAEKLKGGVMVHQWLKQAILLLFRLSAIETQEVGPFVFADKLPLKKGYAEAGVRVVPGASARWGAFLDRDVILMPSYTNIGARVGSGTMVDTWATVGSCAQVGANVHLSGGVGIGGVLEPAQAAPVMIGDDAFIGSRAMIVEGAQVGDGAVVGPGVVLTASIPVIDVETGEEVARGAIPPWCVAVYGTRPRHFPGGDFGMPAVLIIKWLEPGRRHQKAQLNETLRQFGVGLG